MGLVKRIIRFFNPHQAGSHDLARAAMAQADEISSEARELRIKMRQPGALESLVRKASKPNGRAK